MKTKNGSHVPSAGSKEQQFHKKIGSQKADSDTTKFSSTVDAVTKRRRDHQ